MQSRRYYELDWLRVFLILAVFLHHVFMPFNGDDWHIMNKSSSKLLDDVMVYFEQLRLQTLFFIAGAGSLLLLRKSSVKAFLISKFHRLLVPFVVGMVFIIPPQTFFEEYGRYANLLIAYREEGLAFNTNHLWFIEYLIVFMLLAVPVSVLLKASFGVALIGRLERLANHKHGLFALVLLLLVLRNSLKLIFDSEDKGVDNLSVSVFFLFFFISGMCFIQNAGVWKALARHRATNLGWFVFCSLLFYAYYFAPDLSGTLSTITRWQLWWMVCSLVSWSGLLTLLGYASVWCTQTPNWLRAANELIYPFYILHQTVIVVLGFYIVQWSGGIPVKALSLLLASFLVCCFLCYAVIRPAGWLRYAFGLRPRQAF